MMIAEIFKCQGCGAWYEATWKQFPQKPTPGTFNCADCGTVVHSWSVLTAIQIGVAYLRCMSKAFEFSQPTGGSSRRSVIATNTAAFSTTQLPTMILKTDTAFLLWRVSALGQACLLRQSRQWGHFTA